MKKYRITFYNTNDSSKVKKYAVAANNSDEVFKYAYTKPEASQRDKYNNIMVEEIPDEPVIVGLEIKCTDTVLKKNFNDYMYIKANNEQEAIEYYNKHFKGGRFQFRINKDDPNGKCIRKEVVDTFFPGGKSYDADATIKEEQIKESTEKRLIEYRTKSLKQLLEAYRFENDRINEEDAKITKEHIINEVYSRIEDAFVLLESDADVESVYKMLIEH